MEKDMEVTLAPLQREAEELAHEDARIQRHLSDLKRQMDEVLHSHKVVRQK